MFAVLMIHPVSIEHFYHNGRGPELQRVHWSHPQGRTLRAIEYFCPDDAYDTAHLHYVRFIRPQAFMFTSEEVISYASSRVVSFGDYCPAAAFDLGCSDWLQSFDSHHLSSCSHFQLLFYDELLDVICEALDFRTGAYLESNHVA